MKRLQKLWFMKKVVILLFITIVGLSSCKKYENDGFISLRTAKARLTGTWRAEKAFDENGNDVSSNFTATNYTVKFEKNGTMSISATWFMFNITLTGKWEFIENKQSIKITMDANQFNNQSNTDSSTWKILKLHGGELWVKNNDGEIRFVEVK